MRACLTLCIAAVLVGAVSADCDACIDGRCYRKHRLPLPVSNHLVRLLDIDRNRSIVYVIQDDELIQCQLDQDQCKGTGHSWGIWSLAVDQRTGDTYARIDDDTSYSLYKVDLVKNETKLLVRDRVRFIAFKDKLYYCPWSGNGLYTFEDGESRIVVGTEEYSVYNFIVDKNDDIYFRTYFNYDMVVKKLSKGVVDQTVYWEDNYFLTVDRDGNAVFFDWDSLSVYRITNLEQVEVGALNDQIYLQKPLFDRDNNVIYQNSTQVLSTELRDTRCLLLNIPKSFSKERIIAEIVVNAENNVDLIPTRSMDTEPANGRSP